MSRPRAATSVATSTSSAPSRKRPITRSRCSWTMPPWSAAASWPWADSRSARSSTSPRVRANTSAEVGSSRSRIRPSATDLSGRRTTYATWRTLRRGLAACWRARSIRTRTGSSRWRLAIFAIGGEIVAEKRAVWRVFGRRRQDRLEVLGEAHVEHLVGLVEDDDLDRRRGAMLARVR